MNQGQPFTSTPKKIHLIFKTHLDIGFTDYARKVNQQYHDHFLPLAIATGEHLWRENSEAPMFVWTTGAWLISEHLEKGTPESRKKLEAAIDKGIIVWHAMPYTTHTELLSAELFKTGLAFSRELDRRFGHQTTAAKMTDVPGHTLGMVPLMAQAGIRFLHIGVNSASTPPDVPPVFRWRASSGEEIVVMYQADYGATYCPDGMDEGIGFAHTMDNMGPQSISQVIESHRLMKLDNPHARIIASTLTEFGNALWDHRENIPIVTQEIGDSWIHGVGTDPRKISRFMGLRRLFDSWAHQGIGPERARMGSKLCMVAEHTWGVDIKTFLRDETAWDRKDFEAARQSDPRFALSEHSWHEQEEWIDDAIAALDKKDRAEAKRTAIPFALPPSGITVSKQSVLTVGNGKLEFNTDTGGLRGICFPNGLDLATNDGQLAALSYESYDSQDYGAYMDSYLTERVYWSEQDHGKPGLEHARMACSGEFQPEWQGVAVDQSGQATAQFFFSDQATNELGAPSAPELRYRFVDNDTLEMTVCFFGKPANRMPEASFLTFAPAVERASWRLQKLGYQIDPMAVIHNGNKQLHAVESVSCTTLNGLNLVITPLDCPLVGPAETPFLPFYRGEITMSQGIRFCLHNNKWGTNYPMWCEGDFAFRFQVSLLPAQ